MIERTIECGGKIWKRVTRPTFIKTAQKYGKRFDYAMGMDNMRFPLMVSVMKEVEERNVIYPDYTHEEQVKLAVDIIANTMYYYNANKDNGFNIYFYIAQH